MPGLCGSGFEEFGGEDGAPKGWVEEVGHGGQW